VYLYYRIASSEPASYTPSWTTSSEAIGVMHAWYNVDPADPFISLFINNATSAVTTISPVFVKANPTSFGVSSFVVWGRGTVTTTQPSGYTMAGNPDSSGNDATSCEGAGAYKEFRAATDSLVSWTTSNGTNGWTAHVGIRSNSFATRTLAVRSRGVVTAASSTASLAIALPPHHRGGRSLLVAFIGQRGLASPTVTPPTGWNQVGSLQYQAGGLSNKSMGVFWKLDNGAETDPPTWVWSGSATTTQGVIIELDFGPDSPIAAFAQANDAASNTSYAVPALTLAADSIGNMLLASVEMDATTTFSAAPTGYQLLSTAAGFFAVATGRNTGANPAAGNFTGNNASISLGWQLAIGQKPRLKSQVIWVT
jgi:hypothetical protein